MGGWTEPSQQVRRPGTRVAVTRSASAGKAGAAGRRGIDPASAHRNGLQGRRGIVHVTCPG